MWICSKLGFFSIVKKGESGTWQIRARCETDLKGLLNAASLSKEIISTPHADYAFRAVVGHDELERVFAALGNSIDYPNFKSCIGALPGQRDKLSAYHAFWSGMAKLQDKPKSSRTKSRADKPITAEQVFGPSKVPLHGNMNRMLIVIREFKEKYGHWPTKLRVWTKYRAWWRDETLAPLGFQLLESKLQILPEAAERTLVAEDDDGRTLDYNLPHDWEQAQTTSGEGADEWLWGFKIG
jgi:hypothetical protein